MKKSGKNWIVFNFDPPDETFRNGAPKPSTKKTNALPIAKKRNFNFQAYLAPKTIPDLAVHSKKIKEVEDWLQINVANTGAPTAKYLLITGPAGSGKTATVRVLCNKMNINLTEWLNPMDQDFEVFRGGSQVTRFREFLTESKWNSLFAGGDKKVILVEEFPNAVVRNPEEFRGILEECFYKGNYPVIFISTDSVDNRGNLSQTLFPEEIRDKYCIANISFNSCAPTLMKNALKRACTLVQGNLDLFQVPSQSTITAILATAMGDIRNAMNQYYFASILGTADLPTTIQKPQKSNKRKRSGSSTSLSLMSRDETLGLFHGLGRVLNPKLTDTGKLDCNIEKLIDEFSIQPSIFTAFLFENYMKYFGDVDDVFVAAEALSLSQIFLDKWVDHQDTLIFALWVSVMGLMICNRHKVSRWNQIRGPQKIRKRLNNDPETKNLSFTDLFYYNIITKNGDASQFNTNI